MDNIFIYNIKDFYDFLGLNTWKELENQLEKDLNRINCILDGIIVNNTCQLWNIYGPMTKNTLKCLTQNVFFPGLKLLYDNYNTLFIQNPLYHHCIIKNKNIITAITTQQSISLDTNGNVIYGNSYIITTLICSPIVTIEFKLIVI